MTNEIASKLREKISSIAKKYGISYSLLFGSFARRTATEESDVDIAIKVKKLKKGEVFNFLKRFVKDLGMENVDVVILNFAPFAVSFDALMEGEVLFCENDDELFEDRIKAFKLYDDWIHITKHFERREKGKVLR